MKKKITFEKINNIQRRSSGIVEWVCEHNVGHPLTASVKEVAKKFKHKPDTWTTHGCCEKHCCQSNEFKQVDHEYTYWKTGKRTLI